MADTNTPKERAEAQGTNRNTDALRVMGSETSTASGAASSDIRPRKNAKNEADVMVEEGAVYTDGTQEVIPFFVDFARARVRFAPVGRASEDEMRTGDFLNRFKKVEKSVLAEATPAESQKVAEARIRRRETTDQRGHVVERDGKPV